MFGVVGIGIVPSAFAPVTVRVHMDRAASVAVNVKMHPVANHPVDHMRAEQDQHRADADFQRRR